MAQTTEFTSITSVVVTITMQARPQAKHWTFTLNNPVAGEGDAITVELVDYLIVGNEIGTEGTPHHQGYVCFKRPLRLTAVKKLLPRAHWEVAKGSPAQNYQYCSKDGDFLEIGVLPQPQTANASKKRAADYQLAMDQAKRQKLYEVEPGLLIRHMSSLKQIARDHPPELAENDHLSGIWFYGQPGTGKSKTARWLYPNAYPKPCNKWWDGYQNQHYVIIDDFDRNHSVLGHHLKIWADHYPFIAEQKGHSIKIRPTIICVTSNYHPAELFTDDPTLRQAILRRFTIHEFVSDLQVGMRDNKTCSTYQFVGNHMK